MSGRANLKGSLREEARRRVGVGGVRKGGLTHVLVYWLEVMQALSFSSQGYLNAFIYGYDSELRSLWAAFFRNKFLTVSFVSLFFFWCGEVR